MNSEHRAAVKADERTYLETFRMTPEQRQAVRDRDYHRMIALGGTRYFLATGGATDGVAFQSSFMALGDGNHKLPMKTALRLDVDKQAGDTVTVHLDERLG